MTKYIVNRYSCFKVFFFVILIIQSCSNSTFAQSYTDLENEFNYYLEIGNDSKTTELIPKLKSQAKKEFGDTSLQYAKSYYYDGLIDFLSGDFNKAKNKFTITNEYFKNNNPICGFYDDFLSYYASSYSFNNEYQTAYNYFKILLIRESKCKVLSDFMLNISKKNLAYVCLELPEHYSEGQNILWEIIIENDSLFNIDIQSKNSNPDESLLSLILTDISVLRGSYELNNDFEKALIINDLIDKYLSIDKLSPLLKYQLLNTSTFLVNENKLKEVVNEMIELIETNNIFEPNTLPYFYQLGYLNSILNKFDIAASFYIKAIEGYENYINTLGAGIPLVTNDYLYGLLTYCYTRNSSFDNAIKTSKREKEILLQNNEYIGDKFIKHNIRLAYLYYLNGQYSEAEKITDKVINKNEIVDTDLELLTDLKIDCLSKRKAYLGITKFIEQSIKIKLDQLQAILFLGTDKEIENSVPQIIDRIESNSFILYQAYSQKKDVSSLLFDIALITKSIYLDVKSDQLKKDYLSNSPEIARMINEKSFINKAILVEIFNENKNEKNYNLLIERRDSIEKIISRQFDLTKSNEYFNNINRDQIQASLQDGEIAIEFVKFFDETELCYYSLLLTNKEKIPVILKLGSEKEIMDLSVQSNLDRLYDLIWKPLLPFLSEVNTVYYSPVGLLNNIPFHALYKEENGKREYVMDKFNMHQLTSTRYLALDLKKKELEPIENSIALFGGINYNDDPEIFSDTTYQNEVSDVSFLYKQVLSENRNADSTRAGVNYLPGTKKEVNDIAQILMDNQWEVELSEEKNATENKLKSYSGKSKSILHIATHGFAYPDKEEKRQDRFMNMMQGQERYKVADNPMLRSGLLFGGANQTLLSEGDSLLKKTGEEGVLTALELSQMDFTNTKLAVLSACETGKGAIQGSEGTFGLKRALKLAGVDNIIVSLWNVLDDPTMEMMKIFYTELTKTKIPVSSFEYAQKTMRNKYPDEPEKWAGFVFVR